MRAQYLALFPPIARNLIVLPSKCPANCETKCRLRLEIVEPSRIVQNRIQLRLDLQWKNRRIDAVECVLQESDIIRVQERLWGNDFLMQAVNVVRVIYAEWS